MQPDPEIPLLKGSPQVDSVPPLLPASEPPLSGALAPSAAGSPPPQPAKPNRARNLFALLLSLGQGEFKFRWPLVPEKQLAARGFSWLNLSVFLLVNAFVLLPAVIGYLVLCAGLAADHFSDGFLTLRPAGLTVQVKKYERDD